MDKKNKKPNYPYYIYKLARRLYIWNIPFLPRLLQLFSRVMFTCLIHYEARIGKNVHFNHLAMGIVIHPRCIIGDNVLIMQHVTIGERNNTGYPVIGNGVFIGCGAKVLGGIKIGDNASIGANAVVIIDVPEGATAVGVPARIVQKHVI
ncbi:MAG: serine acetyltransferase [Chitinispirillaceae bacterium]|nr:serine acetyltransferase [Chitinispirillaceae bacterium]